MRVSILTVTAGEGHNSTAKAIRMGLEARGIECDVLDTLSHISRALSKTVADGYDIVTKKAKQAFDKGYSLCELRKTGEEDGSFTRLTAKRLAVKLLPYIEDYQPDVIVYTHIFAGMMLDTLREDGLISCKLVGVLTDFVFHPFWEEAVRSDYVVTASPQLNWQAQKKGYKLPQIKPIGIPIRPQFAKTAPKEQAREKLGLEPGTRTVLVMGGGAGYGHMKETIVSLDAIDTDFQLLVICGKNNRMKSQLEEMSFKHKIALFGFISNVDELMDASDCIVSKPGGLSTSEALAKRLPLIIINPIPGQEDRNTEFLLNNGAAIATSPTYPVGEALHCLFGGDRLKHMLDCVDELRRPDSTADLCELVYETGSEPTTVTVEG